MIAYLLPLLLAGFTSALVAVAATGHTPDEAIKGWQNYSASGQVLMAFGAAVALLAAGFVLTFLQVPLLRLLEGYWPHWAGIDWLRRRRAARHRRKAQVLWASVATLRGDRRDADAAALAARLALTYPPPSRLADGCLPTSIGNRLRAAEYYPHERYGIDAVVIWTRLLPLLPADAAKRVAAARTSLDSAACLLFVAVAFGIAWPVALVSTGGPGRLAALCLLAWPVAVAAYAAVAKAAVSYGQEVRVVFDLHRSLLLRHLGWHFPSDLGEERRLWDDLAQFYQRNLRPSPPAQ